MSQDRFYHPSPDPNDPRISGLIGADKFTLKLGGHDYDVSIERGPNEQLYGMLRYMQVYTGERELAYNTPISVADARTLIDLGTALAEGGVTAEEFRQFATRFADGLDDRRLNNSRR